MLQRAFNGSPNAIGPSINDEICTKNFLALAYAIVGVETKNGTRKFPGVSTSCRAFDLYENIKTKETGKKGKRSNEEVKVLARNVNSGEIKTCLSITEASVYTKVSRGHISYLTRCEKITTAGWKFEVIENRVENGEIIE